MHDQIRDMGRSIAEKESPCRLGHQTTKNIDDLLERSSCGTIEVRGITMNGPSNFDEENTRLLMSEMSWYRRWSSELFGHYVRRLLDNFHFRGILNLQLVSAEGDYLERILRRARAPDIQWIRWYKCTHSSLPSWIPMENLEVLEVEGRKIRVLWERESQVPRQLRELSICAPLSRFPKSIMQLKHFEKIDIRNALFKTLPEELCDVHSLKYLKLRDCSEMISLPDSLGNLTNLRLIDLTNASSLQMLPSSFGNLIGLKGLFLRGCPNLTISNESFGNINTLQHLDLKGCSNVKELPPQVAHQRFLVKLDVSATMLRGLPANGIGELSRMDALELGGDRLLELLSPLLVYLRSLKELWLFNCPVLKCLPDSFALLTQLEQLKIENCPELKCLPDSFGLLTQLVRLTIHNCGIEYLPQNLQMNNLRSLDVRGCPLRELPFRRVEGEIERELNTLDKCMFHGGVCPNLQGVFPNLRALYLLNCKELRQIGRLCGLPKLVELHLYRCENIEELSSVDTLISLKVLHVNGCVKLEKIEGLGKFIELPGVEPGRSIIEYESKDVEPSRSFTIYHFDCPKLQLAP